MMHAFQKTPILDPKKSFLNSHDYLMKCFIDEEFLRSLVLSIQNFRQLLLRVILIEIFTRMSGNLCKKQPPEILYIKSCS